MIVMSLQIILRMRRDMSGEELDRAAASVLASFELESSAAVVRNGVSANCQPVALKETL